MLTYENTRSKRSLMRYIFFLFFSSNETTIRNVWVGRALTKCASWIRFLHFVKYCIRLLKAVTKYDVISFLIACRMDIIVHIFPLSLFFFPSSVIHLESLLFWRCIAIFIFDLINVRGEWNARLYVHHSFK